MSEPEYPDHAAVLLDDHADDTFREAADNMRSASIASKSKKPTKMIVAEIVYQGMRHEVWLSRNQIWQFTKWQRKPYKVLAGYLKKKALGL